VACKQKNTYDVIVIGSGIGGLTAAGLLARSGKTVLVLERHDRPGGYAHSFRRKRYTFEAGVHLTSGCGFGGYRGGQVIRKVLQSLDVSEQVEFIRVDPFSVACYPGITVALPQTLPAFVETLGNLYPRQRQSLNTLMHLCLQISEELAVADEILTEVNPKQARQLLPALFQYRKLTLAEVLDRFITDLELHAVFATNWPYLGLSPKRVSFLYWATMLIGYLEDGAYYCIGGFQVFAETLVKGLQKHKGEISYKTSAQKINITNGQVTGVTVDNGEYYQAPFVISNADMRQTVYQLVGKQHFSPRFLSKLSKFSSSLSIFVVYIATDLNLSDSHLGHESFCYSDIDHQLNYDKSKNANVSWISITIPTRIDHTLAPEGQHIIMLTTLVPYHTGKAWNQEKPKFTERMMELAERHLPGLKQHILFIEAGSPTTMERYTLNDQGSAYGWDPTPEQIGPNRFSNRAPITGLYFAGHWSSPGGGVYGVSVSGARTAQQILDIRKLDNLWTHLQNRGRIQTHKTSETST